jgi:hypothetical protein
MSSSKIQPEYGSSSELTTLPRAFEQFPWLTGLPLEFGSLTNIVEKASTDPYGLDNDTAVFLKVSLANVKSCQYAHCHIGIGSKFRRLQPRRCIPHAPHAR